MSGHDDLRLAWLRNWILNEEQHCLSSNAPWKQYQFFRHGRCLLAWASEEVLGNAIQAFAVKREAVSSHQGLFPMSDEVNDGSREKHPGFDRRFPSPIKMDYVDCTRSTLDIQPP